MAQMKPPKKGTKDRWILRWTPAHSPPPAEEDVLMLVRDRDGGLTYTLGRHYPEIEPNEEDDGKPFWAFTTEIHYPQASVVKWSLLPPVSN